MSTLSKLIPGSILAILMSGTATFANQLASADFSNYSTTSSTAFDSQITTLSGKPTAANPASLFNSNANPYFTNSTASATAFGDTRLNLNDRNGSTAIFRSTPATITFNLNTNAATNGSDTGYTINSIKSFTGQVATAGSEAAQSFQVLFAFVSAPSTFVDAGTYTDQNNGDLITNNANAESALGILTPVSPAGSIAQGVSSVQFIYSKATTISGLGVSIHEIEAFGTPTVVASPEPASLGLIGGLVGILSMRRRGVSR